MDGILLGNPKQHLKDLSLGLLQNLTEAVVLRMSYVYENLNVLNLSGVSLAVTDNSLQMIFRHMRLLRFLNVDSCCKVIFYPQAPQRREASKRLFIAYRLCVHWIVLGVCTSTSFN